MTKKIFKPGDRFSHKDGCGYVIAENKAILIEPKSGSEKFAYIDEIPGSAKFTPTGPKKAMLAMNALDLVIGLIQPTVEIIEK